MEPPLDEPPSLYLALQLLTSDLTFYGISGLILVLLLFFSALISGSEVAFFSLTADQILGCKKDPTRRNEKLLKLLNSPKNLLATILILNNLINISIVTISTFALWRIVGSPEASGTNVAILTVIIAFAIVFFGEVVPKVYANQNNLKFAQKTTNALSAFSVIFKPLSALLIAMTSIVEKRVNTKGYEISMDDLGQALEITDNNETTDEERDILKGIVNFGSLSVKQLMRSRMDITAFDIETDFHELMDYINKCGFSRIPIYRETIDKIEGILYVKDLLPHLTHDENFDWQKLLRPGYFIPESKKVDSLLRDFQEKRVHMAVIVDEYGGTSGLITLEDLIEEIVGEINDEFDDDEIAYNKLDENTFIFEGKTSLNDFSKVIEEDASVFESVKGESESLGGLLLELHSKLPRVGDKINFDKFVFTTVAVDQKRIKRVRVFIKVPG